MSSRTELQKMLAGELYIAADPELTALRKRARRLTRDYNQTTEDEETRRRSLLQELFGRVGPRVEIEPPFRCDYGRNIFAGDGLYLNFGCVILDCAEVHLGESVFCGPNVQIYAAHHPIDPELRAAGPELATPVRIGDRVWIGGGAILCPGVTIGANSVIGAGSVVVRDIPPNVVAVGNPCRVVRALA
jgi:maltose O-acetyltransferase